MQNITPFLSAAAMIAISMPAAAATIFYGQDAFDPGGESHLVQARNAQAAFINGVSAYGALATEDLEAVSIGHDSAISSGNMTLSYRTTDIGFGITGIFDGDYGDAFGFNTTQGGSNWLGIGSADIATLSFSFSGGTNGLGFFMTGVQGGFTTASHVTVSYLDGGQERYDIPLAPAGGATFFGIIDRNLFSKVELVNVNGAGFIDLWGLDDISWARSDAIPEPATWALLIAGLGLVGVRLRRKDSAGYAEEA